MLKRGKGIAVGAACLVLGIVPAAAQDGDTAGGADEKDAAVLVSATTGAAPGYVPDRSCSGCHQAIYASYQEVGMARSFYRPSPDKSIEDFAAEPFHHAFSNRYYEYEFLASATGEEPELFFRRFQRGPAGRPINVFEQKVDWVLGSGNRSRTYLYRTPSGELYQLPLAWYTRSGKWAMAPGYDKPVHEGLTRKVRRECMFCHNAYPDVPAGSDAAWEPDLFPEELPQGTGCQRCHGPGADHLRLAVGGELDDGLLRASIVNPARLDAERRNSVCYGCHMQPSVALFGVRRFGAGIYSFRPGDRLRDYLVRVDVVDGEIPREDRFEINHHPYRLEQSSCFIKSEGALSCLTCHDPHRKVPQEDKARHFRAACLGCHEMDDWRAHAESAWEERRAGGASGGPADPSETGDCVSCHMPQRRTQDMVQVAMTDHRIGSGHRDHRGQAGPDLLAPLAEREPAIQGLGLIDPSDVADGATADLYRAVAVNQTTRVRPAVDLLTQAVANAMPESPEPYMQLVAGQLFQGRYAEVDAVLAKLDRIVPGHYQVERWKAVKEAASGEIEGAVDRLERLLEKKPGDPVGHLNRALFLRGLDRYDEAIAELLRTIELRPNQATAWFHLGDLYLKQERYEAARPALTRALAIDPGLSRAYVSLARTLEATGDVDAARRYLEHGAKAARRTEAVRKALEALPGTVADAIVGR